MTKEDKIMTWWWKKKKVMEMKEKTEKVMMKQKLDDADYETRRTLMKVMTAHTHTCTRTLTIMLHLPIAIGRERRACQLTLVPLPSRRSRWRRSFPLWHLSSNKNKTLNYFHNSTSHRGVTWRSQWAHLSRAAVSPAAVVCFFPRLRPAGANL